MRSFLAHMLFISFLPVSSGESDSGGCINKISELLGVKGKVKGNVSFGILKEWLCRESCDSSLFPFIIQNGVIMGFPLFAIHELLSQA
jgi:hypothetical protein